MRESSRLTETQVGAIGENLVASQLMLESSGRLSPFQPVADDVGIDLLIYDKITGLSIPLQIKSRTKTLKKHPKTVHFQVRKATFNEEQHAFVLAVLVDTSTDMWSIQRAWLIPMKDLSQVARQQVDRFVIRPSIDMRSKDKYSPYRCGNMEDVAKRLLDDCDRHSS